jgi:predicted ATPase/class 3 adenylate cyclase
MQCPHCQNENPAEARFCLECGARFEVRCPNCGTELPAAAKFCLECGQPLEAEPTARARPGPASYTPKHLVEKILTSRSAMEGERKQVTVLFADVKGSMDLSEEVDPEEWHRIMDRFFQVLVEGVHRFEGTINQFTGDGIMALFGAPIAHEDHAQRACYAALHLRGELRRYADELKRTRGIGFAVRMGLNSGEVVVGKIGDDLRMDYTAHGHTVGLADRMQKLADQGTAYLSQDTASLVSGYFDLRDLGTFELKGVREPVRVYELQDAGAIRTRLDMSRARGFSRFVGRADETAILESTLEQVRGGKGQVIGIVAEAGVGKSRLCFEFLEHCRARGVEARSAHAVPYGGAVPFFPVLALLRSYFGITDQDDPRESRRKIAGTLLLSDEDLKEIVPLVFEFLGVPDPERPVPEMTPESRQEALFRVFAGICPCRREPTVILVEDLHWADPGTELFLARLAEGVPETPTLFLVNYRPEYRGRWLEDADVNEIRLLPLGDEAISELLTDLLGPNPEMEELGARIRERAAGNPFFVEEVVQSLVEAGTLEGSRGAYQLATTVDDLAIPPTVQSILAARIDRLDERDKEVLQTAAVVGEKFSERLLSSVVGLPDLELSDALTSLEASEFIYTERLYPTRDYAFKHPLTQEVVYRSQLADRRARIHASVARSTEEQLCADSCEDCAALLAHHWEQAGDAANAARWNLQAGKRTESFDVTESLQRYRKALGLLDSVPDSPETLGLAITARAALLRSAAFSTVSEEERARIFAEGKELAARTPDQKALAEILTAYSASQTSSGDADAALEHAKEALHLARETGDPEFEASLRATIMFAYYGAGRLREAVQYAAESYARAEQGEFLNGDEITSANNVSRGFRGMMLTFMGRLDEAERDITRAIQVAAEQGKSFSWMHANLVDLSFFSGRTAIALPHARSAIESAENYGSPFFSANAYRALGRAHLEHGNWDEAKDALEHSLALVRDTRSALQLEGVILAALAEAYLARGDRARARDSAEEAARASRRTHARLYECGALLSLSRVLIQTEGTEAREAIVSALARFSELIAGAAPVYRDRRKGEGRGGGPEALLDLVTR